MSLFNFNMGPDINEGVKEWKNTENGILLDIRTMEEYMEGHIPGCTHLPLHMINDIPSVTTDFDTPIFLYCRSGVRTLQALNILNLMGYNNVKNIGGITYYKGEIER